MSAAGEPAGEPAGERARLFVALDLPPAARAALVRWREPLLRDRPGLRAPAAESLHVTLCFLGPRPLAALDALAALVRARPPAVTRLAWGEPLWLPPRRPGVLALALRDEDGALAALQSELAGALEAAGHYEGERRPYLPHVTVARVRGRERVRSEPLPPPPALGFEGACVTLYRSHPSRGGARYEPLARAGGGLAD